MTHRLFLFAAFSTLAITAQGQAGLSENEKKYLVYTVQPGQKASATALASELADEEADEEVDSMNIWFPNISLCDWQPGMRFMVIPDKKDLVIKTFAEASTGRMVSSQSLLHKVMVYTGHDDANGGLHEHVNFRCEETGADYYFEVPTHSFDDYCYQKFGVPTLAYLGEVDSARVHLVGKKLTTVADRYYMDDPKTAEGFVEIRDVPRDTEVEVIAVGVGTRSFPNKIIVREDNGRQFFQNVAISKTNSGLRDEELSISNMIVHTFDGAFKLADDNLTDHPLYKKYLGQEVYTLIPTTVKDANSNSVRLPRLTPLVMRKIRSQSGSEYAKVTLYDKESNKTYTMDVLFVNKNRIGVTDNQREKYVDNLFALGNPKNMKGVREENWSNLVNGVIRTGYTANEVRLAMGAPTGTGKSGGYTAWYYRRDAGNIAMKVLFNSKTMRVVKIVQ